MNIIKYSIIIPHKNTPDLLQHCINSIPRRDDVQIIIIDDDSDPEIVDFNNFPGIEEKCVEVYITKTGKGAGYARNIGLSHALGKWILFADADDYYAPNFLDILDQKLFDGLDILYYNVFSDDTGKYNRAAKINEDYKIYFKKQDTRIIKYKNWTPWNKVISKEFVKNNKLSFEEIPVGNDAMFSLNAGLKAKNVSVIPNQLYCITTQPQSITFTKKTYERIMSYLKINIRINNFLKGINSSDYQIIITTPSTILQVYKEKGLKTTLDYLYYIHKEFSITESFYIGIKEMCNIWKYKINNYIRSSK